ncbi:beta-ketoacyl synthase N-terminal-like domain-containing protein [Kitasatospora sp. NPDC056531]|uniref:beta-ketoacyl synthase N-terminal-like domain-containing protein n=1 Tax=Kitasatospora sp. NPDC056531 TaxID=3345856 RepID=UPI0036AE5CBB
MDPAQIRQLMEEQLRVSRRLQARIRELEDARHAPLAVVGMGLRLPGGLDTPDAYWDFLRSDGDAYAPIPEDRPGLRAVHDPTPGRPGRSYVDQAGFLSDIAHFDADFFGISEREARLLDPQQRLLLETTWEALERAGIAVRRTDRLDVGVYLGMMASEYSERLEDREDMTRIDPYYTTGGGLCFGAGRISYVMGFCGPVISVDTACSSALSALHLAARGLRDGDCRYALVCGSNLLLSAGLMVSLCQTRALSPEGRSKSFLATADGYGRGEGVGAIALMRLADAEQEGRPILAVIRGTAVNHDGAASGLTAPNGPAQQEVIRAALADAGVGAHELGWVEAHGTGTVLGDPIEVGALDGVLGAAVRERGIPLAIGSVKSRLGHLEAASGIAALIKTVLMLERNEIPAVRSAADGELNPHIPWDRLRFAVPTENGPWPAGLERRLAGVNSFGMSGTNAHAVLEAYEPSAPSAAPDGRSELLTLSAKNPAALAELADAIGGQLRKSDTARLSSLCHTLRAGRAPFGHRVAVTGTDPAELADELAAALERGAGRPAAPPRSVTLTLGEDRQTPTTALAELVAAFPDADCDSLPGLLGTLGLRVRVEQGGPADGPAHLSWEAAGQTRTLPLADGRPGAAVELFHAALAALFLDGADLRLGALRAPHARLLGDLPTYPFQRRRFWVDEPVPGTGRVDGPAPAATRPAGPDPTDREAVRNYLMAEFREALQASEELDPERSFLDSGGDSFISTLFITRVEERYEVGLTPEDLPLDLPLAELFGRLADDIAERARSGRPETTA